jgi:hypothetical protein
MIHDTNKKDMATAEERKKMGFADAEFYGKAADKKPALEQANVMRRLAEVGMKVICRQSGLTATIDTIFPNKFIYSSYDEPTKNSGDGVATTARGLRCIDGADVMHPNEITKR